MDTFTETGLPTTDGHAGAASTLASGVTHADALARRKEASAAKKSVIDRLKEGVIDVTGAVVMAAVDPDVARLAITAVMMAVGWDLTSAERALERIGIGASRRLGWLLTDTGNRHLEAFYELVERPARPKLPLDWFYR